MSNNLYIVVINDFDTFICKKVDESKNSMLALYKPFVLHKCSIGYKLIDIPLTNNDCIYIGNYLYYGKLNSDEITIMYNKLIESKQDVSK